jgi:hypothetical protein
MAIALRISDLTKKGDVAVLNRWADEVNQELKANQTNAAIALQAAVSGSPSGSGTIELSVPKELTPQTQDAGIGGEFQLAWAPENTGTVFGVPYGSNPDVGAEDYIQVNDANAATLAFSATAPNADLSLFLFAASGSGTTVTPAGWTGPLSGNPLYWQATSAGTVNATGSFTSGAHNYCSGILTGFKCASPASPVFLASAGGAMSNATTQTLSCTFGGVLPAIAVTTITAFGSSLDYTGVNVFDGMGNTWTNVGNIFNITGSGGSFYGSAATMWFCSAPIAGTYDISFSLQGSATSTAEWAVYSLPALAPVTGIPSFIPATDLLQPTPVVDQLNGFTGNVTINNTDSSITVVNNDNVITISAAGSGSEVYSPYFAYPDYTWAGLYGALPTPAFTAAPFNGSANGIYQYLFNLTSPVQFNYIAVYLASGDSTNHYDFGIRTLAGAQMANVGATIYTSGGGQNKLATLQSNVKLAPGPYLFEWTCNGSGTLELQCLPNSDATASVYMNGTAGTPSWLTSTVTSTGGALPATAAPTLTSATGFRATSSGALVPVFSLYNK